MQKFATFSLVCLTVLVTSNRLWSTEPVQRYAGIELGSKGVRVLVIEASRAEGQTRYTRILAQTDNTSLFPLQDNAITPDAIKETTQAVRRFYGVVQKRYQIEPQHVHLVGSSAVLQAKNHADLANSLQSLGVKPLVFITPETEARLTIAALVPSADQSRSILVEIGGGNTNGGMVARNTSEKKVATIHLPWGTVSYAAHLEQEARLAGAPLIDTANRLRGTRLVDPLQKQVDQMGDWKQRDRVYLNGGIAWALATFTHPDLVDAPLVKLTHEDIDAFILQLRNHPDKMPDVSLPESATANAKSKLEQDMRQIRDTFSPQQLLAGMEIVKASSLVLDLQGREIVFVRQGYVSWLAAYIAGDVQEPTISVVAPEIVVVPSTVCRPCVWFPGSQLRILRRR